MTDHQIIHGDACEVLPTLGVKANLILTSPPYDNLRTYGGHGFDFGAMADACVGALAEGGVLVWVVADATVDGSETGTSFRHALGFIERGLKLHQTMIYQKKVELPRTYNRYCPVTEWMFVFANGVPATANMLEDKKNVSDYRIYHKDKGMGRGHKDSNDMFYRHESRQTKPYGRRTNVWQYKVGHMQSAESLLPHEHPAIFPLALAKDHIRTWTKPGDLVLDPMAGSGTVSRAAKDLGRDSIAIEIHEPYVGLIRRRMAQEVMELA